MLVLAVSSVAGPLALTLWTYRDVGVVWQGRYGLPFSLGLVVLAGLALERLGDHTWSAAPWVLGAVGVFTVGQAVAALSVLNSQRRDSPSVALGLWNVPSPWLVGGLVVGGWIVLSVGFLTLRPARGEVSTVSTGSTTQSSR